MINLNKEALRGHALLEGVLMVYNHLLKERERLLKFGSPDELVCIDAAIKDLEARIKEARAIIRSLTN